MVRMTETLIEDALNKLASGREGAYVVLEDSRSGKFVQFAGSRTESLVLDLPVQQLTNESREVQSGC